MGFVLELTIDVNIFGRIITRGTIDISMRCQVVARFGINVEIRQSQIVGSDRFALAEESACICGGGTSAYFMYQPSNSAVAHHLTSPLRLLSSRRRIDSLSKWHATAYAVMPTTTLYSRRSPLETTQSSASHNRRLPVQRSADAGTQL